jgi:hypothetical protein
VMTHETFLGFLGLENRKMSEFSVENTKKYEKYRISH